MTKRSRTAALSILGAAAFTLAGCQETATDAASFPDKESCLAAATDNGWFTAADCDTAFADALALHDETAPRYESQALCEEEHGPEACQPDVAAPQSSGGSIFMPIMVGYLLGQALGGGRPMAQPVVRTPTGYSTPGGNMRFSSLNSAGKVDSSAFAKAPVTKGLAPMTKASVQQRNGFGTSGGARVGS